MQGKANMNRVVICIFSVLLFGCSTQPPILQTTSPTIYSVTHPITSFPSLTPTTKPTNTVPPTSTIVPTPALPEAELEKANRLRLRWEYNQEKKDWELIDEMGFILGVFLDNQLLLIDEKFDVIQAGEPEFIHGNDDEKSPVIMTAWDQLALWLRGITPLVSNGIVCMSDGETVTVPIPPGSKQVVNQPMVELSDASLLIYQFNTDDNVVIGENDQGQYMAATFKDGQLTEPVLIQFEPGSEILTKNINENFFWIVTKDGEFQEGHTLLISPDNITIEQKKLEIVQKMNDVYNQNFTSWEQLTDYVNKSVFAGKTFHHSKGRVSIDGNFKGYAKEGWPPQPGEKPISFPNKGISFEALGLDWEIVDHPESGNKLVRLYFTNPLLTNELMSMYVGYVKNGVIKDFIYLDDDRLGTNDDYHPTTDEDFKTILNDLTTGYQTGFYKVSLYSSREIDYQNLNSIFTEYAIAEQLKDRYVNQHNWDPEKFKFDPGPLSELVKYTLHYQLLSDSEVNKVINPIFIPTNNLIELIRNLGEETFIGMDISIGNN